MILRKQNYKLPLIYLSVLLGCAVFGHIQAAECVREPDTGRQKIGLVLGGGGARGAAHIGVIKMLEELQVPVDYVTGTSMGALVGGLYATGMKAEELESVVLNINWKDLFDDDTAREDLPFRRKTDDNLSLYGPKLGVGADSSLLPQGAISGQKISFLLESLTTQRVQQANFDYLPIPFRAVAADLVTGEKYILKEGDLAEAMRSSMSIPGVFSPVPVNDALLVDGGIVDNVPADVAREMGADILIVVSVGTPLAPKEKLTNILAIANQMTTIMVQTNTQETLRSLTSHDILLEPALGDDVGSGDFSKVDVAIPLGYHAAGEQKDALAALGISAAAYAQYQQHLASCVTGPPVVDFVRLVNKSRFSDSVLQERLHIPIGEPLNTASLDKDIRQIFALGFLKIVNYEVVREDASTGVIVNVEQDHRGTDFIEWGLDVFGSKYSSAVNLRLGYLKTDIDEMGTEFRGLVQMGEDTALLAELYKPMGDRLGTILFPRLSYENSEFFEYDAAGNRLSEFQVKQLGAELVLGYEFGNYALLGGGIRFFDGSVDVGIGDPAQPKINYTGGEYVANFEYDRLDNKYFPSHGALFNVRYTNSSDGLGADASYEQVVANALLTKTWGANNLQLALIYHTTLDNDAPIYGLFRGGGFYKLSGFDPNELSGQHFGMLALGFRRRMGEGGFMPAYIGATLEYGNVAQSSSDVFDKGILNASVYAGLNTVLGPVYLGVGKAEDRSGVLFLRIGNVFGNSSIGR